jgi:hypothetical protein
MKKYILIVFAALLLINGCKPLETTIYIDKWHETTKIDSVYKYKNIYKNVYTKGDSVFTEITDTFIDYKYKYLNKIDTVTKTNTEYKIKTEYKTKTVTNWFGWMDWILIGIIVLYGIYKLLKFLKVIQ